jgi:large subunit ribosomal protein L9
MEVILSQNVDKLGKVGDVVKVKEGFARNLLLPNKMAYLATPANLKRIEKEKQKRQAEYEVEKKAAEALAEQLSKVSCTVSVEVNDLEKLYGSISEIDVVKALDVEGFKIDKRNVILDQPIDQLGIFEVCIKLHSEVTAKIRLWVTKK